MRGTGRHHQLPVYLAVLALATIWITPASCKWDLSGFTDRDTTNWYSYGFWDQQGDLAPSHKMFRLLRSNNLRYPDTGPAGQTYHSFRKPILVNTASTRVIAFAQGHRYDNRECGHVTIILRRPKDPRLNSVRHMYVYRDWWKPLQEPFEHYPGTWTNPTPVIDGQTIYLFANWNALEYSRDGNETLATGQVTKKIDSTPEGRRRLFLSKSTDDGNTWSPPEDMTEQLTPKGWGWDVVGRGRGIKVRSGELVVPAKGRNLIGRGPQGNRTWEIQWLEGAGEEGSVVQTGSDLILRSDGADPGGGFRRNSRGTVADGFGPFAPDKNLPDPGPTSTGSMILYSYRNWTLPWPQHNRILFLNSASSTNRDEFRLQLSYYHDGSQFGIWRDLGEANWVFTELICKRIAGRESGHISVSWISGIITDFIAIASELEFRENLGSKDDHYGVLFRHTHISWLMDGHLKGVMFRGKEEKDPAKRIDPDGLRDYPDPEDDPRPYLQPCQHHSPSIYRWGTHLHEVGGNDFGKDEAIGAGIKD